MWTEIRCKKNGKVGSQPVCKGLKNQTEDFNFILEAIGSHLFLGSVFCHPGTSSTIANLDPFVNGFRTLLFPHLPGVPPTHEKLAVQGCSL